jgi:hypothetical protein
MASLMGFGTSNFFKKTIISGAKLSIFHEKTTPHNMHLLGVFDDFAPIVMFFTIYSSRAYNVSNLGRETTLVILFF